MDKIYLNFKTQKKLWELNDQSFINNKKNLIQKRIKKINDIKFKYNNSIKNILKNSQSNKIFYNKIINNSIQNEKNSIKKDSNTNSPSKIINSLKENLNIINKTNFLSKKTQSNFHIKKFYTPKFSLKTSISFFNKKNKPKDKKKLTEKSNCNSVDNIKLLKINLLTERISNQNFYKKLKLKYYSGNKILNKNEKILNKIYNSSPEFQNKINSIKKQKNHFSLDEYQKKLYNNIKTNLSFQTNIKLQNDFYNIRKTIFVPKLEGDSLQFLNKIEKREKQILNNFNNIEENYNSKIKNIGLKDDKLRPIKLNLKKIKFKRIINV